MPTPRWSTVVLDFDGTIADTTELIVEAFQYATTQVLGFAEPPEVIRRGIGRTLPDRMGDLAPDRIDELTAAYVPRIEQLLATRLAACPGVDDVVRELATHGVSCGVATSRRRAQAAPALARLGLADALPVVIGLEDCERHKPHAEPIERALAALGRAGAPAGSVVYVGDAVVDVEASRAAGVDSIAVTWGAGERAALEAAAPDHLVTTADELRELLLPR